MSETDLLWEKFEKSGNVTDYIIYKKSAEGDKKDANDKGNSDILGRCE